MPRILLPFPSQSSLALGLTQAVRAAIGTLAWHRFPDGESLVTLDAPLAGADVAIVASLDRPDAIALALRFAAVTARESGARSVGLVAPYLAYLRQDQRFHAGEAISAKLFAGFLADSFDWIVTVDPHLHRVQSLGDWFAIPAANVAAAPAIAEWIRRHVPEAVLIGPDAESAQWVGAIARQAGMPWQVLRKTRRGDRAVDIAPPATPLPRDRIPVLVDDIISTGRTQCEALALLHALGLPPAICIATHAVFAADALEQLQQAGARRIVTTDTIVHATNEVSVVPLLAEPVDAMFRRMEATTGDDDGLPVEEWFDPRG